ncbi:MAG: hypothetical protein RBS16_03835 [Candidatus Cloacimonadales bacterium]|jgi:hypothetical protein|nr:hypothetical protein [Candidatus Cloacimonadales bacterium]
MKKYILFIVLVFLFSLSFGDTINDLFSTASDDLLSTFQNICKKEDVLLYEKFEGNIGESFSKHLFSKLSKEKTCVLVSKEEQKKLFSEQLKLNDPIFEDKYNKPNFKTPQWLLTGYAEHKHYMKRLKNRHVLIIDLTISNIQSGTSEIIINKSYQNEQKPGIVFTLFLLILIIVLCRLVIHIFKGYHVVKTYIVGFLLFFIYVLWQYF